MELEAGETLEPIHYGGTDDDVLEQEEEATRDQDESVRLYAKLMRLKKGNRADEPKTASKTGSDDLSDELKQQIKEALENPAKAKDVNEGLR